MRWESKYNQITNSIHSIRNKHIDHSWNTLQLFRYGCIADAVFQFKLDAKNIVSKFTEKNRKFLFFLDKRSKNL